MSKYSQHTPGPWRMTEEVGDGNCQYKEYCITIIIDSEERAHMAHIQAWKAEDDPHVFEEVRANARLIVTAPELLSIVEELLPLGNYKDIADEWSDSFAKANSIINKIKGIES